MHKHQSQRISNLIHKVEAKAFQVLITPMSFDAVCEANDGLFASSNLNKFIYSFWKLDGKEFMPAGITTNKVDRVYIADCLNDRVIATNYSLDFLKSIDIQEPSDVFFDGHLYICSLKKIIRCNEDFSNVVVFDMDLIPLQIRIAKQRAIVGFEDKIEIYDCETFIKLFKTL